jgi:myo-inositol-1(or 4)-monophosphatase
MFVAEKGSGAFMNDRRLRVSARKALGDSLMATGIPFRGKGDPVAFGRQLEFAMRETAGVRRFGSASLDLAYIAAGRFDAFWEEGLAAWDVAAGIRWCGAGGYVSDLRRQTMLHGGSILATNGLLHAPIQGLLKPH